MLDNARERGRHRLPQHLDAAAASGATSSPSPSASPTSGRASASIRTRPTRIPTSARRRWSRHAEHPRVIAIGECGLDYYYDKSDRAAQRSAFEAHIEAARQTGLPLIIHTRDAEEDTAEILETSGEGRAASPACSIASPARRSLRARGSISGSAISLSGIVTFKNAAGPAGRPPKWLPADQMLVETDCPVPRAGPAPRPEMRAGVRRRHGELRRSAARRGP